MSEKTIREQTISQQVDRMFREAALSHISNLLNTDRGLAEAVTIRQHAAEKLSELDRLYEEEYLVRVDTTRERLYNEAAKVKLSHPAPPGVATNSDETISQQAHRLVQAAHQADRQSVSDAAERAFQDLFERARQLSRAEGVSKDAFSRAAERRSGQDRRTFKQSQE